MCFAPSPLTLAQRQEGPVSSSVQLWQNSFSEAAEPRWFFCFGLSRQLASVTPPHILPPAGLSHPPAELC